MGICLALIVGLENNNPLFPAIVPHPFAFELANDITFSRFAWELIPACNGFNLGQCTRISGKRLYCLVRGRIERTRGADICDSASIRERYLSDCRFPHATRVQGLGSQPNGPAFAKRALNAHGKATNGKLGSLESLRHGCNGLGLFIVHCFSLP
ncbi:hypothetical protein D3C81_1259250 [compost metagenome]